MKIFTALHNVNFSLLRLSSYYVLAIGLYNHIDTLGLQFWQNCRRVENAQTVLVFLFQKALRKEEINFIKKLTNLPVEKQNKVNVK